MTVPKPWTLPLIVVALLVPPAVGLVVFGPQGMVFAAVVVGVALVIVASRPRRGRPIEVAPGDGRRHVLIAANEAIDDSRLAERIVRRVEREGGERAGGDGDGDAEVLVVAPALNPRLAHWAVDVKDARADAARRLETSLARLRWAGLEAHGSVGDSNPVLAIEDVLREFPADEVLVIAGEATDGDLATELRQRLDRPVTAMPPDASGWPAGRDGG